MTMADLNKKVDDLSEKLSDFHAEYVEFRDAANEMIQYNRCEDRVLMDALIELGEARMFRKEALKRLDGIRVAMTWLSGLVAATLVIYGGWEAVLRVLG